jgi:hypothetical protein
MVLTPSDHRGMKSHSKTADANDTFELCPARQNEGPAYCGTGLQRDREPGFLRQCASHRRPNSRGASLLRVRFMEVTALVILVLVAPAIVVVHDRYAWTI